MARDFRINRILPTNTNRIQYPDGKKGLAPLIGSDHAPSIHVTGSGESVQVQPAGTTTTPPAQTTNSND